MVGIMISIKPDEYCKILNGEQTIIITKDADFAIAVKKLIYKYGRVFIVGCCRNNKKIRLYEYMRKGTYFTDSFKNDFWYTDNKSIKSKNGLIPAYLTIKDVQMPLSRQFRDIAKQACLSPEELAVLIKGKPYFAIYIDKINLFPVALNTYNFTIPISKCKKCEYILKIPKRFCYIKVNWDIGKFIND